MASVCWPRSGYYGGLSHVYRSCYYGGFSQVYRSRSEPRWRALSLSLSLSLSFSLSLSRSCSMATLYLSMSLMCNGLSPVLGGGLFLILSLIPGIWRYRQELCTSCTRESLMTLYLLLSLMCNMLSLIPGGLYL